MGVCCSTRGSDRIQRAIVTSSEKSKTAIKAMEDKANEIERMVQDTISRGRPWTDPDFPPEQKSLYDPQIDNEVDSRLYNSFKWRRAKEIYPNALVFEDGVEPNDIN